MPIAGAMSLIFRLQGRSCDRLAWALSVAKSHLDHAASFDHVPGKIQLPQSHGLKACTWLQVGIRRRFLDVSVESCSRRNRQDPCNQYSRDECFHVFDPITKAKLSCY